MVFLILEMIPALKHGYVNKMNVFSNYLCNYALVLRHRLPFLTSGLQSLWGNHIFLSGESASLASALYASVYT